MANADFFKDLQKNACEKRGLSQALWDCAVSRR